MFKCFGPEASAVMNGRLMSVSSRARELVLGFFSGFFQALKSHLVFAEVDAVFFFELVGQPVDDALVEVTAAQERIAVGGFHFENAVADFEDRDVESTAAQVEHRDGVFFAFLIEAVSESGRGRLVDDALDVEASDAAGVFGRLALSIVEVSRNRDDRFGDRFAEIVFRGLLHFLKNECGNFLRRVFAIADFHPSVAVLRFEDFEGSDFR